MSTREQRAAATEARATEVTLRDLAHSSDGLVKALGSLQGKLTAGQGLTEEDRSNISNLSSCVNQAMERLVGTEQDLRKAGDSELVQKAIDELIQEIENDEDSKVGDLKKLKEPREPRRLIFQESVIIEQRQTVSVSVPRILLDHEDWSERLDAVLENIRYELVQEHEELDGVEVQETSIIWCLGG